MKLHVVYTLLLLISFAMAPALGAPAGELDPAFGIHGRLLLRDAPFEEFNGQEVFIDPASGKLTVVADGYGSDRLLRFNSDGSFDPGFGDQGTALLDFGGKDLNIGDVKLLADGKFLIAGALHVYGTPDNVIHGSALLARMHADGSPDLSFGDGGRAVFNLGGVYEGISSILLQPDGRIVVFGTTNRNGRVERVLVRYTQDGLLDTRFGRGPTPGVSVVDVAGIDAKLNDIVQQADGKFLICGDATPGAAAPGSNELLAIRIHANGTRDVTLGNNGMVLLGGWQDSVSASVCLELADGHIVFAGSSGSDERRRAAAWRMTPDGRLDTSFGSTGMAVLNSSTQSQATTMTVMTDGSLAIAGSQGMTDGGDWLLWFDMFVTRVDPTSGNLDTAFGNQGLSSVDFGHDDSESAASPVSIRQQPDGKLVVVGSQAYRHDWYYWFNIAVARFDPYGSGSNGRVSMNGTYVSVTRGDADARLRLRRTGGGTGVLSVDFATLDASATAGEDYVATSGTVTWLDGDFSEKTISISLLSPQQATADEYFRVVLSNSRGGLGTDQATISISKSTASGGAPPAGNNAPNDGAGGNGTKGGGAIGTELGFLLLLALVVHVCYALKSRPKSPNNCIAG